MLEQQAREQQLADMVGVAGIGVTVILLLSGIWLIILGRRVARERARSDQVGAELAHNADLSSFAPREHMDQKPDFRDDPRQR
jgi:hypothetical protein